MFELSPSKAAALRVLSTAASTPQEKPNTAVAVKVGARVYLKYSLVTCLVAVLWGVAGAGLLVNGMDPAPFQQQRPVTGCGNRVVVGDDHHVRVQFVAGAAHFREGFANVLPVQRAGGFISENDLRGCDQGTRNSSALRLPTQYHLWKGMPFRADA